MTHPRYILPLLILALAATAATVTAQRPASIPPDGIWSKVELLDYRVKYLEDELRKITGPKGPTLMEEDGKPTVKKLYELTVTALQTNDGRVILEMTSKNAERGKPPLSAEQRIAIADFIRQSAMPEQVMPVMVGGKQ